MKKFIKFLKVSIILPLINKRKSVIAGTLAILVILSLLVKVLQPFTPILSLALIIATTFPTLQGKVLSYMYVIGIIAFIASWPLEWLFGSLTGDITKIFAYILWG